MEITRKTTFREMCAEKEFAECLKYLHFEESATAERMSDISLESIVHGLPDTEPGTLMGLRNPMFDADAALDGLKNLQAAFRTGKVVYSVYSDQEIKQNGELEDVKLFYFPGDADKPFLLLCPGGAYQAVCSLTEGFPLAARANRLGYTAFVLNYRVHCDQLFPRPMEDLARAVEMIMNDDTFSGFRKDHYGVAGFSAGGHLAAEWGTDNLGFLKHNFPAPGIIMLGYPAIQMELQTPQNGKFFYRTALGEKYTQDDMDIYSVNYHMTANYPATFLTQCRDDDTVPFENSVVMEKRLKELGRPCKTAYGDRGGHGYALGNGSEVDGWFEKAVDLWETQWKGAHHE